MIHTYTVIALYQFYCYRGWRINITGKFLSKTRFKVTYTLDCNSIMKEFWFDPNKEAIESYFKNILLGKEFVVETEINTFLKWPKTINESTVNHEANTYAIAYLNNQLGDAITYLKKKGLIK